MVTVSRASLRHVLAARDAADDLHHRWAVVSTRTAVLPYGDTILTAAEVAKKSPMTWLHVRLSLGAETVELLLSDEQSKANLNALLADADPATVEIRLRESLSGTGLGNAVRLRPGAVVLPGDEDAATQPATRPTSQPFVADLVSGYGQIFQNLGPADLVAMKFGVRPIDVLTCWGDGAINLRRVTPAALKVAAGTSLTGVEQARILDARDGLYVRHETPKPTTQQTNDPVARIVAAAGIDLRKARGLPRFTLSSNCYSLWIVTSDGRRVNYFLGVKDDSMKEHPRSFAFVW
jgi:hypothetical protein